MGCTWPSCSGLRWHWTNYIAWCHSLFQSWGLLRPTFKILEQTFSHWTRTRTYNSYSCLLNRHTPVPNLHGTCNLQSSYHQVYYLPCLSAEHWLLSLLSSLIDFFPKSECIWYHQYFGIRNMPHASFRKSSFFGYTNLHRTVGNSGFLKRIYSRHQNLVEHIDNSISNLTKVQKLRLLRLILTFLIIINGWFNLRCWKYNFSCKYGLDYR